MGPARVLDVHVDPDHNRAVFTLAGRQGELAAGLVGLAKAAVEHIDLRTHDGVHPHVGALDVMPVVWLDARAARRGRRRGAHRGRASSARTPGCRSSSTATWPPGPSTSSAPGCAAAARPGWRERMESGELTPDYGPPRAHPTAGRGARHRAAAAGGVQRRPRHRRRRAGQVDRGGAARGRRRPAGGARARPLPGRRAGARRCRPTSTTTSPCRWREIVERVRARAPVAEAELIGLAPRAAFDGFPDDVPLHGFTPERHILEEALAVLQLSAPRRVGSGADGSDQAQAHPQAPRHPRRHDRALRAARAARARARRPSRSPASAAPSGSTSRPPGAAPCSAPRSPRPCSACWW